MHGQFGPQERMHAGQHSKSAKHIEIEAVSLKYSKETYMRTK